MHTDILIVGCGCSGLYCALNLPENKRITIITKSAAEESDSFLAQGGICTKRDKDDFDSFFEDTMKAGHYENDKKSVEIMIESSNDVINDLVAIGVDFCREADGSFDYTREGAHSRERILYHKDITGKEITSKLLAAARLRKNIEILENVTLLDIIEEENECIGAIAAPEQGEPYMITAAFTILATGGIGGLFKHSTNYRHLTGDALAIALEHNIELKDIDYIQIHPTTFYTPDEKERSFLISESVRGEGALLYNKNMERFVDELLPRDLLTEAIRKQMVLDGTEFVWEDMRPIPEKTLREHFPNIMQHCLEHGYDVTKECIPVVPAQHYFMGGIKVDHSSRTSMNRLYAIGETACNGVHGKNRLASNSLLESLVFAKRAAREIAVSDFANDTPAVPLDMSKYSDREALEAYYKNIVLDEIDRRKQNV